MVLGNTQLFRDRTNPPREEVLRVSRHCLARPLPATERGKHESLRRRVRADSPPSLNHRTYRFGNRNGRSTRLGLEAPLIKLPLNGDAVGHQGDSCPRLPLKPIASLERGPLKVETSMRQRSPRSSIAPSSRSIRST